MRKLPMIFTLIMTAVILNSRSASAMLPVEGGFIPSQCGVEASLTPSALLGNIKTVCFGDIYSANPANRFKAVAFQFDDGSQSVLKVTNVSNYFVAYLNGDSKMKYFMLDSQGQTQTMVVIQGADGHIVNVSGMLHQAPFTVSAFQVVVTIL
jgi:hypothetical protein